MPLAPRLEIIKYHQFFNHNIISIFKSIGTHYNTKRRWRLGLVGNVGLDRQSYSTPGPVSTWMGDRLQAAKPSRYITSHPGQLSLAIPHR